MRFSFVHRSGAMHINGDHLNATGKLFHFDLPRGPHDDSAMIAGEVDGEPVSVSYLELRRAIGGVHPRNRRQQSAALAWLRGAP